MLHASAVAADGQLLSGERIRETLHAGLQGRFRGARVLALIPDRTRTLPLPSFSPSWQNAWRTPASWTSWSRWEPIPH